MAENYSMDVLCVGADREVGEFVREAAALTLPAVTVRDLPAAQGKDTTPADVAVICESATGASLQTLRLLRASGFKHGAIVIGEMEETSPDLARWAPVRVLPRERAARELATVVGALSDLASRKTDPANLALQRTRQLIAAGEIALGLQHSINNPLTALLAEAQLLEFEELPQDHREAVERIVVQTRRVIELVKGLDGISERKT